MDLDSIEYIEDRLHSLETEKKTVVEALSQIKLVIGIQQSLLMDIDGESEQHQLEKKSIIATIETLLFLKRTYEDMRIDNKEESNFFRRMLDQGYCSSSDADDEASEDDSDSDDDLAMDINN